MEWLAYLVRFQAKGWLIDGLTPTGYYLVLNFRTSNGRFLFVSISLWPCLVKYLGRTSDRIVYRARPVVIVLVLV